MAFTKITGYGISETTNIHVGMVTSTNGVQGVGIFSGGAAIHSGICLLYTSPSPRDGLLSRMPSSA